MPIKHAEIYNDQGKLIELTDQEKAFAAMKEAEIQNALGFEVSITTLTSIQRRVIDQKFFTIPFADYIPVRVGEHQWSTEILQFVSNDIAGDFETGDINTGSNHSRLAGADAGLESIKVPVRSWAKDIWWTLPELQFATRSGNWDVVAGKERARKRNWDLGIQKIAFLGRSDATVRGLLNQMNVNINTTLITKSISSMTEAEFTAFVAGVIGAYQINSRYTAMPNRFYIPAPDFNGLAAPVNPSFALRSKLEYLRNAFIEITGNPDFKILPLPYAAAANNAGVTGLNGKNRYVLTRYDEDSVRMDVPVPYTPTVAGSINGFQWSNVAYGQYTGVYAYRPLETLYFDYT